MDVFKEGGRGEHLPELLSKKKIFNVFVITKNVALSQKYIIKIQYKSAFLLKAILLEDTCNSAT